MGKISRFCIVFISVVLALWGLYPSIWWYFLAGEEDQRLANMTKVRLAQELRVQTEDDILAFQRLASKDQDAIASTALTVDLLYLLDVVTLHCDEYGLDQSEEWTLVQIGSVFGRDTEGRELMRSKMEDYLLREVLSARSRKDAALRLGLDLNGGHSIVVRANYESMEKKLDELVANGENRDLAKGRLEKRIITSLRNRIDQFGLTEPELRVYPDGRIEIILPSQNNSLSEKDLDSVDELLQLKGDLRFHLVSDEETSRLASYLNSNPESSRELKDTGTLASYDLPVGHIIRGFYEKDKYAMDRLRGYLVLEDDILLDGENIISAQLSKDHLGQWEINYSLSQEGAAKQQKIFTNYGEISGRQGRSMAILLDQKVLSYPKIGAGGGSSSYSGGRITGRFSAQESKNLVNVLNSGSLPVSLDIDSQQLVGASLGEESIQAGLLGIFIGLLAVVIFMGLYYRSAGIIANVVLLFNLFFLIAILATMNSTLTLTGIAGFILTIGMSVDANVIIYERIKEELRSGKGRKTAIDIGFNKAFWTIIDSNVTTGIAAICLALFGNGAIQGFAITLAWGIVCSLFTVLFIARLLFDFNTEVLKFKKLSIMWKKSSQDIITAASLN